MYNKLNQEKAKRSQLNYNKNYKSRRYNTENN